MSDTNGTKTATASATVGQAREAASKAVLDLITDAVADVRASKYGASSYHEQIRNLAFAYRLVSGGPQPGSIEISK